MSSGSQYFNAVPLFILFREAIEASIVVSVLLTFLQRSSPKLKKQVWWGVGVGVGIALVLAAVFAVLFYVAQNNVFTGKNLLIFKGSISWVASLFITYLAFAMLRYEGWERKWERKLAAQGVKKILEEEEKAKAAAQAKGMEEGLEGMEDAPAKSVEGKLSSDTTLPEPLVAAELGADVAPGAAVDPADIPPANPKGFWNPERLLNPIKAFFNPIGFWTRLRGQITGFMSKYTLFFVVFFTVLREGLESIVFLFGVGNSNPVSIPISGLIGILCGITVGFILYYTGKGVKDIKWLLFIFATVLFFIAAGSSELGAEALMQAGMFGPYVPVPTAYQAPTVGAITSKLFGGEGQPPAPSASGGSGASQYNDGDEMVVTGPVNLNDGYVYVMTPLQPWWQQSLWDISGCCGDQDSENRFFSLIRPIFGYNSQPCFIDAVFYMGYWLIVLSLGVWKWHKGTLTDADWKHNRMLKEQAAREAAEAALAAKVADTWTPPLAPLEGSTPGAEKQGSSIQLAAPIKRCSAGGSGSDQGTSSEERAASSEEARVSEEAGASSSSGTAGVVEKL